MAEPVIGSTLAGYRLDALIARGGMGVVYRATQLALDRPVALKVIARQYAGDDAFRERFLRESRLAAKLDHPAVVPVYDAREEDGELIVAMRLVEGGDLKKRIREQGPLPPAEAVALLGQVAGALDAAHAAGIVHRDVKPHNILLDGERAYLTDFGLAKALGDSGVLSGASIVGTVEYMSPEQWRGERIGPAADVYSLGCVLYECLTGVVPYARREGDAEAEMPRGLDRVIERAVAKSPADRYATAGELIGAARAHVDAPQAPTQVLSESADHPAGRAVANAPMWAYLRRHIRWLAALGVGVVALVVAAILLLGGGGPSVSSPIDVGRPPLRLAVGQGSVWATSALDGTLSRIDPRTRRLLGAPLHVEKGIAGVATGAGSVWVSSPRRGEVLQVDPATDEVTRPNRRRRPAGRDRLRRRPGLGRRRRRRRRHGNQPPGRSNLQARHPAPRRAPAARLRRRRGLGQQRLDRRRASHRPRHRNRGPPDPGRPRPRRRHRRRRPRLGRRQPLRPGHPRRPRHPHPGRRTDLRRRTPRRHRRRHRLRLGRQLSR